MRSKAVRLSLLAESRFAQSFLLLSTKSLVASPQNLSGAPQKGHSGVAFRNANSSFNSALQQMIVCWHKLHCDAMLCAKLLHCSCADKLLGTVHSDDARDATGLGDPCFTSSTMLVRDAVGKAA